MSYYKDGYEDGKADTIKAVLEIIDREEEAVADGEYGSVICGLERVRAAVQALEEEKG